jgi:dipeptidyl-peptidase 4
MPGRRITSRDVASIPQPGYQIAECIYFSPDDHLLTYLRSPNPFLMRQLFGYDLRTKREFKYGEPDDGNAMTTDSLSEEEQLRREVGVFY